MKSLSFLAIYMIERIVIFLFQAIQKTIKLLSYQPQWTPKQKWEILLTMHPDNELFKEKYQAYSRANPSMIQKFKRNASNLDLSWYEIQEKHWRIHSVNILNPKYPNRLKEIFNPPLTLFYQGHLEILKKPLALGVVGSRRHSSYGPCVMKKILNSTLTHSDHFSIISGLALGIDGCAHNFALKNSLDTIAVVGNGLDIYYPKTNQAMQKEIQKNHLIVSEYPVGTRPFKHHFPQRNRIVVGLSRGVYVVEARKRSGSLITAYRAVDENRDIFVTPASILDHHFKGSNRLLQLGATPLLTGDDLLAEWGLNP